MIEILQFLDQSLPALEAVESLPGWSAIVGVPTGRRELRAEIIEGEPTEELVEAWRELAVRAENPFVTPDWHEAWLQAHPEEHGVVIAARALDGEVAGVVPLVANGTSVPVFRAAGGPAADWFAPACRHNDERAVGRATGKVFGAIPLRGRWRMDRSLADGPWADGLREALAESGWSAVAQPVDDVMPVATFPDGRVEVGRGMKDVRRRRRKLEREHEVVFRTSATPEEAEADLASLLALHAQRWGDGAFDAPMRVFQRAFVRRAAEQGWLRLWTLEVDGTVAAALYCLRLGGTTFGYIHAYDKEYAGQGVGIVLLDHAVTEAVAEGCAEFNFLRGEEGYKQKFGAEDRRLSSYEIVPRLSAAELGARATAGARTAWRRLPEDRRAGLRRLLRR